METEVEKLRRWNEENRAKHERQREALRDNAVAIKRMKDTIRCMKNQNKMRRLGLTEVKHLTELELRIEGQRLEIGRLKDALEKLQDPTAVHVNMLMGDIALPTWKQIKHVYQNNPDVVVAKVGEVLAGVLDQTGERANVQRVEHVWAEKCWIVRWGPFASNSEALAALAALRLITEVSK